MKKSTIITPAIAIVALFAGVGIGGASVQPETRTETKIETVTEEITSQACLTALEDGEDLIQLSAQGIMIMSEAFDAASMFDASGIEAKTAELNALNPVTTEARTRWDNSVAACKGGNS